MTLRKSKFHLNVIEKFMKTFITNTYVTVPKVLQYDLLRVAKSQKIKNKFFFYIKIFRMSSTCITTSLMGQPRLAPGGDITSMSDQQKARRPDDVIGKDGRPLHLHPRMPLQINYEGRVSVLAHATAAPIYSDVSTTLDDSGDDLRESPSSPYNKTSSDDHKDGSDSDGGDMNRSSSSNTGLSSLERLRQICNKSLAHHSNGDMPHPGLLDTSMDGEMDGTHGFHCHLCTFSCQSRDEFNDHVNDHYEFRCIKCDFMTKVEADYRSHLKDEHNLTPEELEDEQGVRVPRINSQGKVKTFKCKQCEFVTVTKEDFWKHCKGHIKPEKLLTCPKCSFVTEYKHHLEYHLRNHFGSKPFRCNHCSYSCVNKSMLNSHMKSHTTIYQYRCADCNYATKYCHSLKLHLRKYTHKPAMVLNPDGTPNPLPIVDVYGTRRGPKIKRDDQGNVIGPPAALAFAPHQGESPSGNGSSVPGSPGSGAGFPLLPPYLMAQMKMNQLQQSFPPFGTPGSDHKFPGLGRHHHDNPDEDDDIENDEDIMDDDEESGQYENGKFQFKCAICDFETLDRDIYRNHMMLHATRDKDNDSPRPNSALMASSGPPPVIPISRHFPPIATSEEIKKERHESETENNNPPPMPQPAHHDRDDYLPKSTSAPNEYLEYLKRMAPLLKRSAEMTPSPNAHITSTQDGVISPPPTSALTGNPFIPGTGNGNLLGLYLGSVVKNFQQREASGDADSNASSGGALDLSQGYDIKVSSAELDTHSQDQSGRSSSGNGSSKSRRKGRAYKIERKLDSLSGGGDSSSIHSGVSSEPEDAKSEESEPRVGLGRKESENRSSSYDVNGKETSKLSGSHICELCQIAFMDACMYSYHKECHDRSNPLKCIKCGMVMLDARGFFLHLIRESHQ